MPKRPFRPGLTSQPSEENDIVKASSQPILEAATMRGQAGPTATATGMTVDAENGAIVANAAAASTSSSGAHGNSADDDDERSSLLGKSRKMVS